MDNKIKLYVFDEGHIFYKGEVWYCATVRAYNATWGFLYRTFSRNSETPFKKAKAWAKKYVREHEGYETD